MSILEDLEYNYNQLKNYDIHTYRYLCSICGIMREKGINLLNLRVLHIYNSIFLSKVSTEEYEIQIQITNQVTALLAYWYSNNDYRKTNEEFLIVHFLISENHYNNSCLLGMLGISGLAWEYAMKCINPTYKYGVIGIDFNPIFQIWESGITNNIANRELIIAICSNYFYLSKILGHNIDNAIQLYKSTKKWIKTGLEATLDDIKYLCHFYYLLKIRPSEIMAEEVFQILKEQYSIELLQNSDNALKICQTLCTINNYYDNSPVEWAQKALDIVDDIGDKNRNSGLITDLTLTVLMYQSPYDKSQIMKVLTKYLDNLYEDINKEIIRDLQKQRMSHLINKCIVSAFINKEYNFAAECAYLWKCYPNSISQLKESDEILLLVFPNMENEKIIYLIYYNGLCEQITFPRIVTLSELIDFKNQFEGTWTVIVDSKGNDYNHDNIPKVEKAQDYYDRLIKFYCPQKIAQHINNNYRNKRIQVLEIPWLNSPVEQIIDLYTINNTSTLVSGNKRREAKIKKILIWCDPDSTLFFCIYGKGSNRKSVL